MRIAVVNDMPLAVEVLRRVINEIDRITDLLKGLLNYARPPEPETVPLAVNRVLDLAIKSARYSLRNREGKGRDWERQIEFVKDFEPELPTIFADPGQLQQIFLNLMLNAVDALVSNFDAERPGVISIQTRQVLGGAAVQVAISDNGEGIDSKLLPEIFKPFFTTKPHGTGLGLAITKRLIEQQNGGRIAVVNNPLGQGVTFTITLPVIHDDQTGVAR